MKVKPTKRAKVWHEAGETVDVSPVEAAFLLRVYSAVPVEDEEKKIKKKK